LISPTSRFKIGYSIFEIQHSIFKIQNKTVKLPYFLNDKKLTTKAIAILKFIQALQQNNARIK